MSGRTPYWWVVMGIAVGSLASQGVWGMGGGPMERGMGLLQEKRYSEALTLVIQALEQNPGNEQLRRMVDQVTHAMLEEDRTANWEQVRQTAVQQAWRSLGQLSPTDAQRLFAKAKAHERFQEWILAWLTYRDLMARHPTPPDFVLAKERQVKVFERVARLSDAPDAVSAGYRQGLMAYSQNDPGAALMVWEGHLAQMGPYRGELLQVIQRVKTEWEPRQRAVQMAKLEKQAKAAEAQGQWAQAKEAWTQVLVLQPEHGEAKTALARADRKLTAMTWFQTAQHHVRAGDLKEAVQATLQAFRHDPEDPAIQGLMDHIELQLARQIITPLATTPRRSSPRRPVVKESPPPDGVQAGTLYNLGLIQYTRGNVEAAMGHWRKALFYDPGHLKARQALARAIAETKTMNR